MQLGPDDKIYICNGRSPSYLSSINSPDLKGKACDVRQHNVSIVANSTMPNFPYFRLGALKGSSCDTIGLVGTTIIEKNNQCKINYNRNIIEIEDPQQKINAAIIYTINGIEMNRYEFNQPSTQETINIQHLINGIYFLELKDKKGIKTIQKLIVQY
ncbi:MAG: T9SS type A sorting domain-containing protein [Saprospiraceae bacterium]|nr:T9SS type A sorting domain-containing protein [Candidatus Defluviibacterium haderslevense]